MRGIISICLLLMLCGCADLGYYWHSANGHLRVMNQRVDIDELLADDSLETDLRERLELVQEIRRFSIERLELPANHSYASYVELDRPYVLQNLFAAAEFSTRLYEWCYPIIGCAGYRGYYDEDRMLAYADDLRSRGLEVYIGQVPAYSTLGWFDDPVLSSFINWPDYRLAGLLFHELTHQQVYIDDDTTFNESLASAVQQVGTELWLKSQNRGEDIDKLSRWLRYREQAIGSIEFTRETLAELYASDITDAEKRERKKQIFTDARKRHDAIAKTHQVNGGFTRWFADDLNNAKIGSVAAYNSLVPAFINMIHAHQLDFRAFFNYANAVGALEKRARDSCLATWKQTTRLSDGDCPDIDSVRTTAS
ncbi:MAG: aminopeptidase [Gammaproteobacteria bacterium]|nr:aminopeptidase [Gammaproteobacteria bacterium]